MASEQVRADKRRRFFVSLGVCAAGILINLAGARLAASLSLPLFLDSIGTVLAAVLGGTVPGIAVGLVTNLINDLSDSATVFYSSINVLLAICAAWCSGRGWFRRLPHLLGVIALLALIGGGMGSVLTWFLYGENTGEGISAGLTAFFLSRGLTLAFIAQLAADLLIDLLDKSITVLIAVLALRLIPESLQARLRLDGDALPAQARPKGLHRGLRLRVKVMLLITATAVLVTGVITAISLTLYRDSMIQKESRMAQGVARTAASCFDPNRVDEYLTEGENATDYLMIESRLADIAASAEDIQYVYVYRISEDGCHVVFDPDTPDTEGSAPGEIIPFDEAFRQHLPALLRGEEIEPVVSNETYGWLLSVYMPVRDATGACACYVGVDISMTELIRSGIVFLTKVISLFLAFLLLLLAVGAHLAENNIVQPINAMADAADDFAYGSASARQETLERIRSLGISTGDEIENLYRALEATTDETVRYIQDVQQKNEQISRLQNGLILVLADVVESRDKCTGNHVRNTATYAHIIMEKMREMGLHPDELTDEYISEVTSSAPLHDVGKIQIPDAVLNKPGRLTEEEFSQMKKHTVIGGHILERVKDVVAGDAAGYLKEACNLTEYHHERWDGKGYPKGLKGSEIPLSARVMAVADVFDALVARRSYKEGFPFEKAVGIIQEESGTHFDPAVVAAFMQCLDQVRPIAEEANVKSLGEY
ncbi:MAG: HD domain-containing protein [Clostridia bacterium]|nr:HD domain-containing protein [Clostridia bacterium]